MMYEEMNNSDDESPLKKKKVHQDSDTDYYRHLNVYSINRQSQSRYFGYKLYFDEEDVDFDSPSLLVKKIEASINFMHRNSDIYDKNSTNQSGLFSVSVDRFYEDEKFISEWVDFKQDLENCPEETLNCLGLALYQCVAQQELSNDTITHISIPKLKLKVFDYKPTSPFDGLGAGSCGKLIEISGRVVEITDSSYQIEWLLFLCSRCLKFEIVKQPDGVRTFPKRCRNCGKRKFKPRKDSLYTKSSALRGIKLRYLDPIDDNCHKTMKVKLLGDLVDSCSLYDNVTIVGILKTSSAKARRDIAAAESLYLEAVSVIKIPESDQLAVIDLNDDDYEEIERIHAEPDIFSKLVRSFCPKIYGDEVAKAGLLLSLFGGSSNNELKDNIHVLVVGDSGVGKSELLKMCAEMAPKSVYVNVDRSMLLGLNVKSARKKGKDPIIESGAIVQADGGYCVMDEFEKLTKKQYNDIFDAIEHNNLSVHRSGIDCSVAVKTSIVAAVRPIGGRYNYKKSFYKNICINKELLSRFDIIFMLLDQPDPRLNASKAEHIINNRKRLRNQRDEVKDAGETSVVNKNSFTLEESPVINHTNEELIPKVLFKKYILYARQINTNLSEASATILKNYFVEFKHRNFYNELFVSNQLFESLIRLTQARAKSELREETNEKDAQEVIKIHKFTMDCLKKVILESHPKIRYKKSASEDIRLYFKEEDQQIVVVKKELIS
ncbi:DNA helicase MCM8 [Microplitis demolitor]|uniref:DNA helicase MCM8 n=1 Tax=Microplitis demolitor TaxID=69319 RepID=UPI0004CDB0C4|nr:DNA helicase MCM8 [Microplitis demolitor]XP_008544046.1 DNA helicase MCM8 [Microplitis demolitor]XP_008544047.1 DNA helicase MCM8 [Microplitis demolitor]XP_053593279.1 DNA helicase MCM8 [Microplitis demolitor]